MKSVVALLVLLGVCTCLSRLEQQVADVKASRADALLEDMEDKASQYADGHGMYSSSSFNMDYKRGFDYKPLTRVYDCNRQSR